MEYILAAILILAVVGILILQIGLVVGGFYFLFNAQWLPAIACFVGALLLSVNSNS